MVGHGLDGADHRLGVGVQVLVHRRTDHHDQVLAVSDRRRVRRRRQGSALEGAGQYLGGIRLEVGHLARPDAVDGSQVGIEEHHPEAGVGERQPERKPDVATATEDRNIARPVRPHPP